MSARCCNFQSPFDVFLSFYIREIELCFFQLRKKFIFGINNCLNQFKVAIKKVDHFLDIFHSINFKVLNDPGFAGQLASVSLKLLAAGLPAAAEPFLRECLAIRETVQPDDWTTFNTQSMLGGALLGQKKYAEAEPLLLAGYEGLKQREESIPPPGQIRLPEALDRLIELTTALDQPDATQKWRAEREKYPPPEAPPDVPK